MLFFPISAHQHSDLTNSKTEGFFFMTNVLSTHTLCYLEKCSLCPISPLQVVGFEKFQDKRDHFFKMSILVPTSLCYLEKYNFSPYLLSKQSDLKNSKTKGVFFMTNVLSTHTLCYLEKCSLCPISPLQVVGFEKFQDKRDHFFKMSILVPTSLCYLEKYNFSPYLLSKQSDLKNSKTKGVFFMTNVLSTHTLCFLEKCCCEGTDYWNGGICINVL